MVVDAEKADTDIDTDTNTFALKLKSSEATMQCRKLMVLYRKRRLKYDVTLRVKDVCAVERESLLSIIYSSTELGLIIPMQCNAMQCNALILLFF